MDQSKTGKAGERAGKTARFRSDAHSYPDDVRSGHELAEGQRIGKVTLGEPPPPLDGGPMRQDDSAAKTEKRDFEKFV
jgi:hypothetical protein